MKTYFNNTNAMNTRPDIKLAFRTADKEPHRFIRIRMDESDMLLDYKGQREYKILNAMVFAWPSDKHLRVLQFVPGDTDCHFYAALAANAGAGFKIQDDECVVEGYQEFLDGKDKDNQGMFCIFKTDCGTILITYRAADKYIGFSFAPDIPESESVADQLYPIFEFMLPSDGEDDE